MLEYKIKKDNEFDNIKELLKTHFDMSDRLIVKLKNKKRIFKNDIPVYVTEKVSKNDLIKIDIDFEEESDNIVPVEKPLDILYEDDYLLIINKEPGYPIHPSINHYEDSISNFVKFYFKKNNIKKKIRIVTRLDKDTSGIVIFAKSDYIQECLIKQMKENLLSKEYLAILVNNNNDIKNDNSINIESINKNGLINIPIRRKSNSIIERELFFPNMKDNGFKPEEAKTKYEILKTNKDNNLLLVKFKLLTGRTHQIRIHSTYLNCFILGDSLYGNNNHEINKLESINRQALHAYKIEFIHPILKKKIRIKAPIPNDMNSIINNYLK